MDFWKALRKKFSRDSEREGGAAYEAGNAGQTTVVSPYCDQELTDGLQKARILCILAGAVLFALCLLLSALPTWGKWIFLIAAATIAGFDVYRNAVQQIRSKQFSGAFLYSLASILLLVSGSYVEGVGVILLLAVGEIILDLAKRRCCRVVSTLADSRPIFAVVYQEDGGMAEVHPREVAVGQTILVQKNEYVPLNCRILDGNTELDYSIFTGCDESCAAQIGDEIPAGVFNLGSDFTATVTQRAENSTAWRLMAAVEASAAESSNFEKHFRRLWHHVTLGAIAAASFTLVICLIARLGAQESICRAVALLVLAGSFSPVVLIPLVYFSGISGAARQGVLFKKASAVDILAQTQAVVFDKAGTVTRDEYQISAVTSVRMDDKMFLQIAALAEGDSQHPIAAAIREAAGPLPTSLPVQVHREHPGLGVSVLINGVVVTLGSFSWMQQLGVQGLKQPSLHKSVYMAIQGTYAGCAELGEAVNVEAEEAIFALGKAGCDRIAVLSGGSGESCSDLAKAIGVSEYYAECQSEDKEKRLRDIKSGIGLHGKLLYVVGRLRQNIRATAADLCLSMDGLTLDGAAVSADIVALDGKLTKVPFAIQAALSIRRQVKLDCTIVCGAKLVLTILAVVGVLPIWGAVTADFAVGIAIALKCNRAYYLPSQPDWKALVRGEL